VRDGTGLPGYTGRQQPWQPQGGGSSPLFQEFLDLGFFIFDAGEVTWFSS
jgi:hypothetical protein